MRKEKFTPGPWKVTTPNGIGNGMQIESVDREWPRLPEAWLGYRCTDEEQKANALLMAAAPDLYEALKDMLHLVEEIIPIEGDVVRKTRRALAKARGES